MVKKPTRDLGEEHGAIMLMLTVMERVAPRLRKGQNVKKEHLKKIIEFLVNFADKCHHGKEEGILFPILAKKSSNRKLVNELLGEHKTGRDYVRGISASFAAYKPGNPDAIHIAVNMEGYIRLLTVHIRKENTVLFPKADRELSRKLQEKIEERFEKFERDVMGPGKHEQYHLWLKELKQIYLA